MTNDLATDVRGQDELTRHIAADLDELAAMYDDESHRREHASHSWLHDQSVILLKAALLVRTGTYDHVLGHAWVTAARRILTLVQRIRLEEPAAQISMDESKVADLVCPACIAVTYVTGVVDMDDYIHRMHHGSIAPLSRTTLAFRKAVNDYVAAERDALDAVHESRAGRRAGVSIADLPKLRNGDRRIAL